MKKTSNYLKLIHDIVTDIHSSMDIVSEIQFWQIFEYANFNLSIACGFVGKGRHLLLKAHVPQTTKSTS